MGTEKSKGMTLYSLSGHVTRPGQYEAPLGITLRELIDLAGGVREGHELKFWTPGGSSTPMLTAEHLDVPLDYEGVGAVGSMLGTKALQIFDETTCVVRAVLRWTEFYKHESCGKCTPCREGTWWLVQILERLEHGKGTEARPRHPARPVREHHRPLVLRAGRRCDRADHQLDPVLPRRVPGALRERRLPVRPDGVHCLRYRWSKRMTIANNTVNPSSAEVERTDLITLTIDGIEVKVPKDTLVIRAAEQIGDPDPAVLRPPAARPGRRLPAVPGRDPRRRATAGGCRSRRPPARSRSPTAWWSRPR